MPSLVERFLAHDRGALARLITRAEDRDCEFAAAFDALYSRVGRGFRLGITGPPGAGKSTLVDGLAAAFRAKQDQVAVLAVDPSSPFTGGALLGDRIRMRTAEEDSSVFVRSMATRGSLGGLARAAIDACDLIDAFGFTKILIETVGVGQAEHDVVSATDTVIVVLYPGGGDSVQAMKAGLMEIADVFVVNKSDHPAADRLVDDIEQMLELRRTRDGWKPPVHKCVATSREGVPEIVASVELHHAFRKESGALDARRNTRRDEQVRRIVDEELRELVFETLGYKNWVRAELSRHRSPHAVAADVVSRMGAAAAAPR